MATQTSDGILISDGFDYPVGSRSHNADVFKTHKVDTELVDPAYYKSFKAWHPGEDWNGRGGGDTDLGDPIYAISHGRVVEFGDYPPSWGNIVLIEHALPDGSRVWSQYAHLDRILVKRVGQTVRRGQQIGTMGKGAKTDKYPRGRWIAHLHFEIRRKRVPINNWRPMVLNRGEILFNYHRPQSFINARRPGTGIFAEKPKSELPQKKQDPIHIIVDSEHVDKTTGVFQKANVDLWYSAPGGYYGTMLWTYSSPDSQTNWGEWRAFLPKEANWQVWAFIPTNYGTTTSARYLIEHLDGRILIGLDQSKYNNKWAYLGTYRFGPGKATIRLSDMTGESGQKPTTVAFDAISWTLPG